jgi:hypothetical protein
MPAKLFHRKTADGEEINDRQIRRKPLGLPFHKETFRGAPVRTNAMNLSSSAEVTQITAHRDVLDEHAAAIRECTERIRKRSLEGRRTPGALFGAPVHQQKEPMTREASPALHNERKDMPEASQPRLSMTSNGSRSAIAVPATADGRY